MQITEIQINLTPEEVRRKDRVLAFVRVVFDYQLAVRDIKILERDGQIQLGMPSRKVTEICPKCHRRASDTFCSFCSARLPTKDPTQRVHYDTTHPITSEFRTYMERHILEAYNNQVPPEYHLKMRAHDADPNARSPQ
jgi:stage V sporulation protein G